VEWVGKQIALEERNSAIPNHHRGTLRKFHRRLRRVVQEGEGVLVRHGGEGCPLDVTATETRPPAVVDISSIRGYALQRFVVAAIFAQVSAARASTDAMPNLASSPRRSA
jgi:hypothetical protein